MRDNEIVNMCYNFQVRNNENTTNWATLLKRVLDNFGLGYTVKACVGQLWIGLHC
jgi:hypothetical protein